MGHIGHRLFLAAAARAARADPADVRAMLADRFQLVLHTATRLMPAATLSVAPGGAKLKPDPACDSQDQPLSAAGPASQEPGCGNWKTHRDPGADTVTFRGVTMAALAQYASSQAVTVLDQTGLQGAYDFTLSLPMLSTAETRGWTREQWDQASQDSQHAREAADLTQLGLKLTLSHPTQQPVPILVVDHIAPPKPD